MYKLFSCNSIQNTPPHPLLSTKQLVVVTSLNFFSCFLKRYNKFKATIEKIQEIRKSLEWV
ncbi:unknown [Bacteroides clarus CAG:160]|nr:unknown [Bacteroides clarus CAG:160]